MVTAMCTRRNALVTAVVSTLKQKHSKSRWNCAKSLCSTGLTSDEVSQITLHLRNNPHLALRFFFWSEKNSLCTHDLNSYATIIHVLARSRFKTLAQKLIQTAIQVSEVYSFNGHDLSISSKPPKLFETLVKTYRSCDSAPFVFDLLIRACLKAKKLDRTVAIVRMLRFRNISPSIGTCNLLIRVISQIKGSNAGFAMYREVFKLDDEKGISEKVRVTPNVQTFNTLMLCFYQDGILEKVEEIWGEMGKFNCHPNVFSYCVLLAAFCDEGKMKEAIELWEDMRIKRIKPDVIAYNTMISGFCKSLDIAKAEELFREMELSEIKTTCVTYEHLVRGYCKIGDDDSAMLLYKDMCRKDFKPETRTVDMVIGEMCKKRRIFEGLKFLRDVMNRGGFYPSRLSYEFLIKGLCEDGKMDEALELQVEMVGKGFEPNLEIYKAFIAAYSKLGNKERARKLTEEMLAIGFLQEEEA